MIRAQIASRSVRFCGGEILNRLPPRRRRGAAVRGRACSSAPATCRYDRHRQRGARHTGALERSRRETPFWSSDMRGSLHRDAKGAASRDLSQISQTSRARECRTRRAASPVDCRPATEERGGRIRKTASRCLLSFEFGPSRPSWRAFGPLRLARLCVIGVYRWLHFDRAARSGSISAHETSRFALASVRIASAANAQVLDVWKTGSPRLAFTRRAKQSAASRRSTRRTARQKVAANPLYDYVFLNLEGAYDAAAVKAMAEGLEPRRQPQDADRPHPADRARTARRRPRRASRKSSMPARMA